MSWKRLEKAKGKRPCKASGDQAGGVEGLGGEVAHPGRMLILQWAEQDRFIPRTLDLGL